MSEIQKHIESCKSEDPLAQTMEAVGNESNLQAALQPLLVETMPGYEPVATTAPTSPIAELPGVLISIIRRVATKPLTILGDRPAKQSLLGTLLATWNAIRNRLSGNPSLGIPDRRAEMTAHSLPTALALLSDRKIVSIGVPDGLGIMQLMTSRPSAITAIGDDMVYDLCYCSQLRNLVAALPSLNEMNIHCKRLTGYDYSYQEWFPSTITKFNGSTDTFEIEELERFEGSSYIGFPTVAQNFKKWSFPNLVWSRTSFSHSYNSLDSYVNDWVEEINIPKIETFGGYASNICLCNFTALKTLIMGKPYTYNQSMWLIGDNRLGHLEFRKEVTASLNLSNWNPDSDVIADPTFLQNFKEHIALRLTSNGSGKTLTLSQAVRDAIHAAEATYGIEAIIVTQKGWTLSPAPTA